MDRGDDSHHTETAINLDDLFLAVLAREMGFSGHPTQDMPEWLYNGLAFAEVNDLQQFANTPEYQNAMIIGHIQIDTHWFG